MWYNIVIFIVISDWQGLCCFIEKTCSAFRVYFIVIAIIVYDSGKKHIAQHWSQTGGSTCLCFVSYCTRRLRLPQVLLSSSMRSHIHLYIGQKEALKYFRFSSILLVLVDRCSKRRLPGLVSSLYSCRLTHPHYITIRLPLKVILPEHNHTQSKPQTSYIKETVNSLKVYFLLPQKCFRSIHKLKLWWLELRSDGR